MSTNKRAVAGSAAALALVTVLTGCGGQSDASGSTPQPAPASAGTADDAVTSDLEAPWSVAFTGDTALISERDSARILVLRGDGTTSLLTTVEAADRSGEGGLLGIAVHDGYLYAYVTAGSENRIVRQTLQGGGTNPTVGPVETVLGGVPAGTYHNGGRIAFGPDGMLYATTGDTQRSENAQDLASLAGKILRMTPAGQVPADNPFPGSYVHSYGHRNPQGIAWAADGTMYATEFGQDTWDELNVIRPGANYGWPVVEGIGRDGRYVDPVQQWRPADASPSGMTIARDAIWVANLRGQSIRRIPLADPTTSTLLHAGEFGRVRDVVVAPGGELWAVTSNTDGSGRPRSGDDRILRLTDD